MTISDLRDYTEAAEQDRDSWLGQLCIYSVADTLVNHQELAEKLRDGGLEDFIPAEPKDENVWRRCFTDGVRRTLKTPTADDPDASQKIMMRTVSRGQGKILKHVVVESVDVKGRRLDYAEALSVEFDADNPHLTNVRVIGEWHAEAWDLVNQLRDQYARERGCVDGDRIRALIREVFEDCHAASLRPTGGCYFLRNVYLARAEALAAAADVIPGSLVHLVPIIDNALQRANLKRAVEMESRVELDRLLDEMRGLVSTKTEITAQRAAAFATQSRKAKEKMREYETLLNDGLDTVGAKLQIFDATLGQLLTQVKA